MTKLSSILFFLALSLTILPQMASAQQKAKIANPTSFNEVKPAIQNIRAQREEFRGFYIGALSNYTYQENHSECSTSGDCYAWDFSSTTLQQPKGFFGAIQFGYNYRFQNNFLLGLEGDISNSNISDTTSEWSSVYSCYYNSSTSYEKLSTARVRGGYILNNNLIYGTIGVGYSEISDVFSSTDSSGNYMNGASVGLISKNYNSVGMALGGGLEHAFNKNWSIKIDYVKIMFGAKSVDITVPVRGGGTPDGWIYDNFKHDLSVIRIGVNYSF